MDKLSNTHLVQCFICLGSNIGSPEKNLKVALEHIENIRSIPGWQGVGAPFRLLGKSNVYLTEPQNYKEQPFFANQVIKLGCANGLAPVILLHYLQSIEGGMGRVGALRYGPRIIDLDILLFDDCCMQSHELTLPHPRLQERAFVLVPLAELAPELLLSKSLTVNAALNMLDYSLDGRVIYQK